MVLWQLRHLLYLVSILILLMHFHLPLQNCKKSRCRMQCVVSEQERPNLSCFGCVKSHSEAAVCCTSFHLSFALAPSTPGLHNTTTGWRDIYKNLWVTAFLSYLTTPVWLFYTSNTTGLVTPAHQQCIAFS